jgi:hypothetical protein
MTQATAKKVAVLIRNTEKCMPKIKVKDSPFASSGAKYYLALKKLAAE